MEPTVIPAEADSFEVDGVRYTCSADISVARYRALQKWELQFGFNCSFKALWEATGEIKKAIDERKSISEIAFINESIRRGFANVDSNLTFALCVVALWYNADGEDAGTFNYDAAVAKMNRWEAAGLGMGFFFPKAAACVRGYRQAYQELRALAAGLPPDPSPKTP